MPVDATLLSLITQGAMLGVAAAATPGPLLAYLITQTLSGGWKRGAPVAFAPLLSDLILVPVILLLLKQLNPQALRVLGLAGGIFVLYTAGKLWVHWRSDQEESLLEVKPGFSLRQGVLMNFLSPGAYVYWTTVNGPLVINAWKISFWHAAGFVAAFYTLFVGAMLGLVLALHFARQKAPNLVRGMMVVGIIILAGFGLVLTYRAIRG